MVESLNTVHDHVVDAVFISGFAKYGQIMVGDRAFEFFKNGNPNDHFAFRWSEIEKIEVEVHGEKVGRFFALILENHQKLRFSSNQTGPLMRVIRDRIGNEKIIKAPTFGRSLTKLFRKRRKS
ncbi:DUF956 family protein [Lactococcus hircilactis]|uniref:DUF956 family protein n=1 Tax=Lactococcus hircilactis TaxID=1494462 RepID=A0A7X2D142_9LACT|nr:DUF956 family protein [Lactococcus hircilactis]MQW40116.1 DUF956 family protein [Lactococcus hircilactis]